MIPGWIASTFRPKAKARPNFCAAGFLQLSNSPAIDQAEAEGMSAEKRSSAEDAFHDLAPRLEE